MLTTCLKLLAILALLAPAAGLERSKALKAGAARVPKKLAKKLAPRKRGPIGTFIAMVKAFWGSLIDPNYGAEVPKALANVHGVYDSKGGRTRSHVGAADGPTSLGSSGGGG
ncbi:hypothetical protein M885DRAFT_525405 [Pelagophyceae sp. CCMP2097]|nr:hypothetical protein M885DRAFT_525405 [Pelagophyceae sp. CCMP2097]